jgi:hypothetical protein
VKYTEEGIAFVLATKLFPWRRYVVVPNVSWGLLPHEADLVVLSKAGWLDEIEIKVSVSDFKRDAKKWKHRLAEVNGKPELVRGFYYAMPEPVYEKVRSSIPEGVGVILVVNTLWAKKHREAVPNASARKLTDDEAAQLLRLGYIRYWARQESITVIAQAATAALERHIAAAAGRHVIARPRRSTAAA